MRKLLVDNWFIEEVISEIDDENSRKMAFHELLNAIVLWDEIYYPAGDDNILNRAPKEMLDLLKPIEVPPSILTLNEIEAYNRINSYGEDRQRDSTKEQSDEPYSIITKTTKIIANGALKYMLLSRDNNYDYLPCSKRRVFLNDVVRATDPMQLAVMKTLDYNAKQFYKEVFSESEIDCHTMEIPLLARYIMSNEKHKNSLIESAIDLRNDKSIEKFKKHCEKMEKALYRDSYEYTKMKIEISELMNTILRRDKDSIVSFSITLLPFPSVSLGIQLDGSLLKRHKHALLSKLTEYAAKHPPIKRR